MRPNVKKLDRLGDAQRPWGLIRLANCAGWSLAATIHRMALEGDYVFELRYEDYSQACREAGVVPLTLDALQHLIAALTEAPQRTIH